jgi:phage terminase Nu1 subunit (DNA packaging protein)
MKFYSTKPNARRAARRAGLDPDLVRVTTDGRFFIDAPPPVSVAQGQADLSALVWLFDCSARTIQKLAQRGIVVRADAPGQFDEKHSTRNYVRHLREQAAGRVGQDAMSDGVAANVRWKDASTELVRLRLQKEAGQVVDVEEVRDMWGRIVRGIRQLVLALPGKIAFEVPTLNAHDRAVIDRICRDGLEDASLERGFKLTGPANGGDDVSSDN